MSRSATHVCSGVSVSPTERIPIVVSHYWEGSGVTDTGQRSSVTRSVPRGESWSNGDGTATETRPIPTLADWGPALLCGTAGVQNKPK